ncbi:HET-domain-containing protein [Nemania sp. FL0031]|nr:HET-domain-containing protein [Nemania sp. FL0031]
MSPQTYLYSRRQYNFPGVQFFILQQTSVEYRYLPLGTNEIRLIKLRPVSDGPNISISFIYTTVEKAEGTYEALSYAWGGSTRPHVLLCDGSYLKITTSLQSALSNLRLDSAPRQLWVDAICINQPDSLERGRQVVLMEQIYRNASKTIVYLGDRSVDSDLAAKYLESHMARVKGAVAHFINQRMVAQDNYDVLQICIKSLGVNQAILFEGFDQRAVQKALMNLLSRPWFRRIWVIQEFVVSPTVDMYCGKTKCEWGSFAAMFYYSFVKAKVSWNNIVSPKQKTHFFRGLAQIMQMHELRNKFHDKEDDDRKPYLIKLLSSCRAAEATMPVDKIFALVNLSSGPRNPEPDYLKSKGEAYLEVAELALDNGDGRKILCEAALTNREDPSLPSWVPDWSEPPFRINLSQIAIASEGLFFDADSSRSTRGRIDTPLLRVEGTTIFVKGVIVQTIAIVGPNRPVEGASPDEAPNLVNLINILSNLDMFLGTELEYPTGEEKSSVAARILEADQQQQPGDITSFWEETHSRDLLFEAEPSALSPDTHPLAESMRLHRLEDPRGYANMCRAVAGRRLAITDQAYIGLVPDTAKEGDKICILQGFNVPFILRQIEKRYKLLGDAYVHGIMLGELFAQNEKLKEAMVEIAIG